MVLSYWAECSDWEHRNWIQAIYCASWPCPNSSVHSRELLSRVVFLYSSQISANDVLNVLLQKLFKVWITAWYLYLWPGYSARVPDLICDMVSLSHCRHPIVTTLYSLVGRVSGVFGRWEETGEPWVNPHWHLIVWTFLHLLLQGADNSRAGW